MKIALLTVLVAFWAGASFASADPEAERAALHARLTAELDALGTIQTDERFDMVKVFTLGEALSMLPSRGVYQDVSSVLAQIPATEIVLRRLNGALAAATNDVSVEMNSKSLTDLFNLRSSQLDNFAAAVAVPFDEATAMKALYRETLDEAKANSLCIHFFSRKQKGEDLTGEIREFVGLQSGKPGAEKGLYNDLRFQVICAADGVVFSENLDNVVRAVGNLFGRNAVDSTFNALGHNDTWPVWNAKYGIKHGGDRGGQVYDKISGVAPSADKAAELEVRRWFARR